MTNAEIYAYIAVCEEMNISKAAGKLFISQSSLSTRLKTLENELGYQLFMRGKGQKQITLTTEGEEFYKLALSYQDIVRKMFNIGGHKRVLRVSSVESVGTFIMTLVYERFMARRPDVVLEIENMDTKEAYENVQSGFIDLALYSNIKNFPKLKYVPMFSEKLVFICETDNEMGDLIQLKRLDVKDEVYIPWSDSFEDWHGAFFGNNQDPYIKIELISQLEHFVMKKGTWAIVPSTVANGLIKSGKVVKKQTAEELPQRMVFYSYISEKHNKELTHDFLECTKEVLIELNDENIEVLL